MNYIASNVCLKSSDTHPLISFGNFIFHINLIKKKYVMLCYVIVNVFGDVVSLFSIRNDREGVFSYVHNILLVCPITYFRGVANEKS